MNDGSQPLLNFIYTGDETLNLNEFKTTLFERYRLDFKTFQILEIGFRTIMSHPKMVDNAPRFGGYLYEYFLDEDNDNNPLTNIYKEKDHQEQIELIEITLMNYLEVYEHQFGSRVVGELQANNTEKTLRKGLKFNLGWKRREILPNNSTNRVHPYFADYLTEYIHNSYIYWSHIFKYYFHGDKHPPVCDFISYKIKMEHLNDDYFLNLKQIESFYSPARIRDKIEDVKYSPRFIERTKHIIKGTMGKGFIKAVIDWEKGEDS